MKRFTGTLIALALLGGLMAGCHSGSSGPASGGTQTAEGMKKQVDAVKNNPDMPQSAKDAAIAGLEQAKARGDAAAQQSAAQSEVRKAAAK